MCSSDLITIEHAGEPWQGVTSREMTFASVESEQVSNGTYFDKASLIARTMIKQETTDNKTGSSVLGRNVPIVRT